MKKKKIENDEKQITKTICLNSLFIFFFRSFEFAIYIFIFIDKLNYKNCHEKDKICSNISQVANLIYLISCSIQIITFFFTNKNFRNSLKYDFFKLKKKLTLKL